MMQDLTTSPVAVLMVYESDDRSNTYLEISNIENGEVVDSRPVSLREISDLIALSGTKTKKFGVQPVNRHILAYRQTPLLVAWVYPKTTFSIIVGNETVLIQGIQLLLMIKDNKLYAFFIKKNCGMNTILYDVNLPNISNGAVCTGSYKMKVHDIASAIHEGEIGFFETAFLSHTDNETIKEAKSMKRVNKEKLKPISKLKEYINA